LPDGNVYCEGYSSLYNSDGVKIGAFEIPADNLTPANNDDFYLYDPGYQVDQQGNIYLVKYSLDHYSILKWTYVGPEAAAKSKSSTAPESKSTAKPAPSTKPSARAGTSDIKKPGEQKPEATPKPPAKEGKNIGARALLLNPCYIPWTQDLIIDNILNQLCAFYFPAGSASRRA